MRSPWNIFPGVIVAAGGLVCASLPAQSGDASQASEVQVRLQAKDGKTQFLLGDAIRLELVFSDPSFATAAATAAPRFPQPGQHTVNTIDYGDLADDVTITPATGWFKWSGRSGHDLLTSTPLTEKEIRVPLTLNEGYVFREPGHYEVSVTTQRVSGTYNSPITTNPVGIDIAARSPEEEAALVRSLNAQIESFGTEGEESSSYSCKPASKMRDAAAQQLAYLTGDDAAAAKVHWVVEGDSHLSSKMVGGLASTRDQDLQLRLLKEAWADPKRVPNFEYALSLAEQFAAGKETPGWRMVMSSNLNPDSITRQLQQEHSEDMERVIATLPQRSGDVRRDTVYFLMENNSLAPAQAAALKPVVLEEFVRMEPMAQSMLIETRWNRIKDASLEPALRAMLDNPQRWTDQATALERLIDLDPAAARPYAVRQICSPQRGLMLDKLKGLHDRTLPEVDECLAALLRVHPDNAHQFDWQQKAILAARFATPAILPAMRAGWSSPAQDAPALAVLLRDDPDDALTLLKHEQNLNASLFFDANNVFQALGDGFPPKIMEWLRGQFTAGVEQTRLATYELQMFGKPEDKALLEVQLTKLRLQWTGREAEVSSSRQNDAASAARMEEIEIVLALRNGKAWTMSDAELERTGQGCLSDQCRLYTRPSPSRSHPGVAE